MLDLKFLRNHTELVQRHLRNKGVSDGDALVHRVLDLDESRRAVLVEVEALKKTRNEASQAVAKLKKNGEDASSLIEEMRTLGDRISTLDAQSREIDEQMSAALLQIPNVHAPEVPIGEGEDQNVEVRRWGTPKTFDFPPQSHYEIGEKLGIVGASGAGKSSLVSLLLRLYDTENGRILIDGHDVRGVTQESLRRQIGMVTQETAMFNRTARDNILYGRPDATEDEVIAAARAAEAHDFIMQMVDHNGRKGYDAYLGERGVKLSGGQRQRIALARAFLKDAPILVLDEATSALDSEVEASIQESLGRVMQGKTVLAIAHRLSTISAMDRIIVMDQGRILEQGTHLALLAKAGLYARYWNRQSGGFIGLDDKEAAE